MEKTKSNQNAQGHEDQNKGTKLVVYAAMAANIGIAIAKLFGGLLSGSAAMLAEGAHSIADTMNEVFLLLSLKLSQSEPDEEHPYGYGKDRFFWSFVAAVFIFFAGGVFSIVEGVNTIRHPEPNSDTTFTINYIILGVAFLFESSSLWVNIREIRKGARAEGMDVRRFFQTTTNTAIKVPLFEDSAALIGLALAGAGLALTQTTGIPFFDGLASICIGVLLMVVAWIIGADSRDLLLGQSMRVEDRRRLREILLGFSEVTDVYRLLTMSLSPNNVLVNAELHLIDGLTTDQIEQTLERATQAIRREMPEVTQTFLELHATGAPSNQADEDALPEREQVVGS